MDDLADEIARIVFAFDADDGRRDAVRLLAKRVRELRERADRDLERLVQIAGLYNDYSHGPISRPSAEATLERIADVLGPPW